MTQSTTPSPMDRVDKTAVLKAASCAILGITAVFFLSRQFMKGLVFKKVALDDLFVFAATLFAIGLSLTTFILASQGLGVLSSVSVENADTLMKGYYASELLYILGICFAKLSILVLFHNIVAVQRVHRRFVLGFGISVLFWSIASIAAVAFQCHFPRPWELMTLRCFNSRVFWIAYSIIDMVTEIAIIILSISIVAYLKVKLPRKVAVVACFAPRTLVIAAALVRLVWLYPITPHSDPQFRLWLPAVISQIQVCLSVCTASIPFMVPFFKNLEGSLRRHYPSNSRDVQSEDGHTRPAMRSRRHRKGKVLNSWDSTAVTSSVYERIPQFSPYLPTPRALSPLTPPQPRTPASERRVSRSIRDLEAQDNQHTELLAQQKVSLLSMSPGSPIPQPLFSHPTFATEDAPTPPRRAHNPHPSTVSSNHSKCSSGTSNTQPYVFSLFPQQRPRPSIRMLDQQESFIVPTTPVRKVRSQAAFGTPKQSAFISPYNVPIYGASQDRFFRDTPSPHTRRARIPEPLSPTKPPRRATVKNSTLEEDLDSPMGSALDKFFERRDSRNGWLSPPPAPLFPSPKSSFEQQSLSPYESPCEKPSNPQTVIHIPISTMRDPPTSKPVRAIQ